MSSHSGAQGAVNAQQLNTKAVMNVTKKAKNNEHDAAFESSAGRVRHPYAHIRGTIRFRAHRDHQVAASAGIGLLPIAETTWPRTRGREHRIFKQIYFRVESAV